MLGSDLGAWHYLAWDHLVSNISHGDCANLNIVPFSSWASHHFKMRKRFLSFVQQGGGRLCARPDQNDVNNYEKNEVRKVTNLHKAESESFFNNHKIPFREFLE